MPAQVAYMGSMQLAKKPLGAVYKGKRARQPWRVTAAAAAGAVDGSAPPGQLMARRRRGS